MQYIFPIEGGHSELTYSECLLNILGEVFIAQIHHYGKFTALHYMNFDCFTVDESNQVKFSRKIMRRQGCFFKLLWDEVGLMSLGPT